MWIYRLILWRLRKYYYAFNGIFTHPVQPVETLIRCKADLVVVTAVDDVLSDTCDKYSWQSGHVTSL